MRLELVRHAYLPSCTLGWLHTPDFKVATIERPWIRNDLGPGGVQSMSCVEDGFYFVRPHNSERFPKTFALVNDDVGVYYRTKPVGQAWGRTAILIHVGNVVSDVQGCIAVGMRHGELRGDAAVLRSREAMAKLNILLGDEHHELEIRPAHGTAESIDHHPET